MRFRVYTEVPGFRLGALVTVIVSSSADTIDAFTADFGAVNQYHPTLEGCTHVRSQHSET